jgi:hypothetical protein
MKSRYSVVCLSTRCLLIIFFIPAMLLAIFTTGCTQENSATLTSSKQTTSTTNTTSSTSSQYYIAIVSNDKQIVTLTVTDLAQLPQVKTTVGGTEEQGPTLLSVLNSVSVKDFSELTVYGFTKGRVAEAELILKRAEVTDNVILALVSRGTAKLTGTDIGTQKAVIDVNKIVVK